MLSKRILTLTVLAELLAVACRAPQPAATSQERLSTLVNDLTAILATDSGRRALTPTDRDRLVAAVGIERSAASVESGVPVFAVAESLRSQSAAELTRTGQLGDNLVRRYYPQLMSRTDGTRAVLAIVLDEDGRIVRHTAKIGPELTGDVRAILSRLGVDTVSARTKRLELQRRDQWHLHMIAVTEGAGPAAGAPTVSGYVSDDWGKPR